ncbi:MAG TPA: hypothetical protein VFD80_08940 [Flavobacteriaceae bacterium]|nr:hypothetical protein [Flavobacteriaceae bacterium]
MKTKTIILLLFGCTFFGVGLVSVLFLLSEEKMQRNNAFQRRYVPHPIALEATYLLPYNSYYIAGIDATKIYLGNVTSPLHIAVLDNRLKGMETYQVSLEDREMPFRHLRTTIQDSSIYLSDGTVPVIFRGTKDSLSAQVYMKDVAFFSQLQAVGSHRFVIRSLDSENYEHMLALLSISSSGVKFQANKDLLEKQFDGFFDTDGMLLYNKNLDRIVYVYYYKNSYVVIHTDLQLDYVGKTIDTVATAQLDVIEDKAVRKLGSKTLRINGKSFTYSDYLFITSNRLGRYESEAMLDEATIVDVYSLTEGIYLFSFYVYHVNGQKLDDFYLTDDLLVTIQGKSLQTYRLDNTYFKNLPKHTAR